MLASGLISSSRLRSASTFTSPMVRLVAISWRLQLVTHTLSQMCIRDRIGALQIYLSVCYQIFHYLSQIETHPRLYAETNVHGYAVEATKLG